MRLSTLLGGALLLGSLCGCMRTYHVERSSVGTTGIDTTGHVSCCQEARQDEREWHGPWFTQPDKIRP
jgi:hypothetical protein